MIRLQSIARLAAALLMLALSALSATAQEGPTTLVWLAPGSPGSPQAAGTLAWLTAAGESTWQAAVPDEGREMRLFACGPDAVRTVAPPEDGQPSAVEPYSVLMAFVGAEQGGLYAVPLDGSGEPVRLADAHRLACVGPDRAGFSPDGARWAFIEFPAGVTASQQYPSGELRVLAMPSGAQVAAFPDVVAFALEERGAVIVQFFTDARRLADEAVVSLWDGSAVQEWAVLSPAPGCDWTSAALDIQGEMRDAILSLGQRCAGGSQWRLFRLAAGGSPVEHVYMPVGGAYLPTSTINQVTFIGQDLALATYPNGRAANIANLVRVDLATDSVTLVTSGVTVDTFPAGRAQHLRFSPDGRSLAYTSSTANSEEFLHRLALDGDSAPLTIGAGSRGDVIGAYTWRPDGALVYLAGGIDGADNALFVLPAGAAEPLRILRGRFVQGALAVTDGAAMLLDSVGPAGSGTRTANLVRVGYDGAAALVMDGQAARAVAYPLLAR